MSDFSNDRLCVSPLCLGLRSFIGHAAPPWPLSRRHKFLVTNIDETPSYRIYTASRSRELYAQSPASNTLGIPVRGARQNR